MNTIKSQWEEGLTTILKVFFLGVLSAWAVNGFGIESAIANWKSYAFAGGTAVAAFVYTWLDKRDDRYGPVNTDM